MKPLKVIVSLGIIPLCVYIGSFISLGGGNGAILGGILGCFLFGILWFRPRRSVSNGLDMQYQPGYAEKQGIEDVARRVHQAHIEEEIRMMGTHTPGF